MTFLLSRICPKGVSGAVGVLHESGCPTLVLSLWPWSPLFLPLIAAPGYRDLRPSHGVAPSMVFPTHGYRGTTLWLPCFSTVWSGDTLVGRRLHLGDALPWRRLFLVTLALSVSSPMRRLVLTLTSSVDFDLDLVNARVRDGTPAEVWDGATCRDTFLYLPNDVLHWQISRNPPFFGQLTLLQNFNRLFRAINRLFFCTNVQLLQTDVLLILFSTVIWDLNAFAIHFIKTTWTDPSTVISLLL